MAPDSPRKEIPSPRTTHHGTCSGRKTLPKCRIRKMPLKFCRIHPRIVLGLPAKKSAQKSKCGVVQNSPSAEFGKLEKKICQMLSDASEILHIPSAHCTWLAISSKFQVSSGEKLPNFRIRKIREKIPNVIGCLRNFSESIYALCLAFLQKISSKFQASSGEKLPNFRIRKIREQIPNVIGCLRNFGESIYALCLACLQKISSKFQVWRGAKLPKCRIRKIGEKISNVIRCLRNFAESIYALF